MGRMALAEVMHAARTNLRVARAQIRASMMPMPQAAEQNLLRFAGERLDAAATIAANVRTRRPMADVARNARDAAELISNEPSLGNKMSATANIRTALSILRQEPELQAHRHGVRALLQSGAGTAG